MMDANDCGLCRDTGTVTEGDGADQFSYRCPNCDLNPVTGGGPCPEHSGPYCPNADAGDECDCPLCQERAYDIQHM